MITTSNRPTAGIPLPEAAANPLSSMTDMLTLMTEMVRNRVSMIENQRQDTQKAEEKRQQEQQQAEEKREKVNDS